MKTSPGVDSGVSTYPSTPGLLAKKMVDELPEIEYATAVRPGYETGILTGGDKRIKASSEFVDQNFFKFFSYKLIDGNANAFNAQKYGLLLSDKIASKLFNTTKSLIGKSVAWSKGEFKSSYIVAGVFQSPPENATDQFDLLFNYELFKET